MSTGRRGPPALSAAAVLVAAGLLLGPGADGAAGQRTAALTVGGGLAPYDLSGVGTSWVAGAELSAPVGDLLLAEVGSRIFRYESQAEEFVTHLFPAAGLYLDAGGRDFRVYSGGGVGASVLTEGRGDAELTLHAAAGFRIRIRPRWLVRPEIRVRSIDPWAGTTAEFTVGMTYRFGAGARPGRGR